MRSKLLICTILLSSGGQAFAYPLFPYDVQEGGENCQPRGLLKGTNAAAGSYVNGETVAVVVESDIAAEMNSCSPGPALTSTEINRAIQDAAEVWNREGRGRVLQFAGTLAESGSQVTCASVQAKAGNRPAIWVSFAAGNTIVGAANQGDFPSCPGVTRVRVRGSVNAADTAGEFADTCSSAGTGLQWWVNAGLATNANNGNGYDLQGTLTHELGHALGLRHRELNTGDSNVAMAFMAQTRTNNKTASDRHLFDWDKDCVDDPYDPTRPVNGTPGGNDVVYNERTVRARFASFDTSGAMEGSPVSRWVWHTKGMRSGGNVRDTLGKDRFVILQDTLIDLSELVSTTGTFGMTSFHPHNSLLSSFEPFVAPVITTLPEYTTSQERNRISMLREPWFNWTVVDPPIVNYATEDGLFGTTLTDFHLSAYTTAPNVNVQSHIPLQSAYDPKSNRTVFAHIDTTRTNGSGQITIHPGLTAAAGGRLRSGVVLDGAVTSLPVYPDSRPWNYSARTQTAPGLACAPNRQNFAYNCLIAWKDTGSPAGHILFTYFRVKNGAVQYEGNAYILDDGPSDSAHTSSDVSVAYFDDSFWIAYKTQGATPDVAYHQSGTSGYDTFGAKSTIGETRVVDAPTWSYVAGKDRRAMISYTVDVSY